MTEPASATPAAPGQTPVRRAVPFLVVAGVVAAILVLLAVGGRFDEPTLGPAAFRPTTTSSATLPEPTGPGPSDPATATAPTTAPTTGAATTDSATTTGPDLAPLAARQTEVATVRPGTGTIAVFDGPDGRETRRVENPGEYGQDQVFVVVESQPGWIEVQLPVRPNGSAGWIRADDVTTTVHDYQIHVGLTAHRMQVQDGAEVVLDTPVGVGTSDTPTPGGLVYTWVLIAPTNSGYGAYAYGLSGFSEVLERFGGSDARLGIHGTKDSSSIGRDVSHGCVRVPDEAIVELVEDVGLPLGVPVVIEE